MSPQQIAIAVIEQDNSFLIGPRGPGVPLAGLWEFPGGKVQSDETPAAAVVREVLEETSLACEVICRLQVVQHSYPHGTLELHFFKCRPVSHSAPRAPFVWMPRSKLSLYSFPEANHELVARLIAEKVDP